MLGGRNNKKKKPSKFAKRAVGKQDTLFHAFSYLFRFLKCATIVENKTQGLTAEDMVFDYINS